MPGSERVTNVEPAWRNDFDNVGGSAAVPRGAIRHERERNLAAPGPQRAGARPGHPGFRFLLEWTLRDLLSRDSPKPVLDPAPVGREV